MKQQGLLLTGIAMAALAVAIGAFGAHGLKEILARNNRTDTFELAVRYQFYHAFALIITGILTSRYTSRLIGVSGILFLSGILFFSGSLYVLSLTGITALGAITPIGGVLFIAGWVLLFFGVSKNK